jgi:hypothetical protein
MSSIAYGSHPNRLDDLLGHLSVEDRSRVRILTSAENREYESISLNQLPQTPWGTIDWSGVVVLEEHATRNEVEAAELFAELVRRYVDVDSGVVLFWGNLVVPSLMATAGIVAGNAEEVLATSHDVWLFAPSRSLLIEYFHEGRLTVAEIPAAPAAGPT